MKLSKLAGLIALVATFSISSYASTAPSTNTLTMPKSLSDIFKKTKQIKINPNETNTNQTAGLSKSFSSNLDCFFNTSPGIPILSENLS